MDMVLRAAGATTLTSPSNELYAAMQTGACDAVLTSSTSLILFRLEEVAKSLTSGRGRSYWFMLEPLIMSKQIFDAMPKAHRDVIVAPGDELQQFGTREAKADDQKVADVCAKKGARVADLDDASVDKWRAVARDTAWKDCAQKSALSAELLKLAEQVPVSWSSRYDSSAAIAPFDFRAKLQPNAREPIESTIRETTTEECRDDFATHCVVGNARSARLDCVSAPGFACGGADAQDLPPVSGRHHRRGRFPRPAVPQVRR
jgi:hypothetical protein